jgi:hypothetical protein
MRRAGHGVLVAGVVAAMACGGSSPPPQVASTPTSTSTSTSTPTPTPTSPLTAPAPIEMKSPVPTALLPDLQMLGLDPKNLRPIDKLEPKTLRGVMKLFARSLGVKCGDCHQEGDFAAPTRRKKIAVRMWNEFAGKLAMADGGALFCDSCHQGRVVQLDRRDKKTLSKWMEDTFVAGLRRKDGLTHDCETCHVDLNMTFLTAWGR